MRLAILALSLCFTSSLWADDAPASSKAEPAPVASTATETPTKPEPVAAEPQPSVPKADSAPATEEPAKPVASGIPAVAKAPLPGAAMINPTVRLREITVRMEELKNQLQALRKEQHEFAGSLDAEAGALLSPEIDEVTKELKSLLQERIKLRKETKASEPAKAENEPIRSELSTDPGGIRIELTFGHAGDFVYVGPPALVLSKLTKLRDSGRLNAGEKAKLEPIIEDVRKIQGEVRNEKRHELEQGAAGGLSVGRSSRTTDEALKRRSAQRRSAAANRGQTEESEKIEKSLDRLISLKFVDTPLSEVIRQIGTRANCNVFLDAAGLEEAGQTTRTLISQELNGLTLRSALTVILEPLKLGFLIDNEVLKITSLRRVQLTYRQDRLEALLDVVASLKSLGREELANQLNEEEVEVVQRKKGMAGFREREDDDDNAPLMRAVQELRHEVRETRKDVAELRKMIEGMKTSDNTTPMLNAPAGPALVVDPPAVGSGARVGVWQMTVPYQLNGTTSGNPFQGAATPPGAPMIPGPGAGAVLPLPSSKLRPGAVTPPAPAIVPMIPGPGPGVAPVLPPVEPKSDSVASPASSKAPGASTATEADSSLNPTGAGVTTPMTTYRSVTEVREVDTPSGKVSVPVTRLVAVQVPPFGDHTLNVNIPAPVAEQVRPVRQAMDGSIERQLKTTRVTMTMENSSLYKILMRIGAQANVRIEVDNKTLGLSGDAWKFDDRSFSIDVKEAPASKALIQLLDPYALSYIVKDGAVTITTKDGAASKLMRSAK